MWSFLPPMPVHDSIKEQYELKNQLTLFDHLDSGRTYNKRKYREGAWNRRKFNLGELDDQSQKCEIVKYDRKTIKLTDRCFEIEIPGRSGATLEITGTIREMNILELSCRKCTVSFNFFGCRGE
jgi:hypothetical protein